MATDIFTKNIKRGYEQSFPLTKISRKRAKDKKWVTLGIKKSCNHKSSLYKKFLKHPTQENKAKYIKYRNLLSKLCKAAQENYFHDIISETKSSLVKLWETFGPIINPGKRKELHKIEKINKEGSILTNKKDIANHFNNYFCNIGKKLQNNVPTTNKNYKNYLTNQNLNSFFISPVSEDELLKVIHTINNRKAKGIYDIPANIFKRSFNQIKNPLLSLLNMSFSQGIFPDIFKIAKVIPLYKKQDRYLTENYRPISLLSYISKIFEKLMKKRLCSFLNKYNILYDLQFWFREGYSTNLALLDILDDINTALDNGKYALGIYLDLSKAFDTVCHDILLNKLAHYGIRGPALAWFKSYLTNRKQLVQLNETQSDLKNIDIGVPQGSVF